MFCQTQYTWEPAQFSNKSTQCKILLELNAQGTSCVLPSEGVLRCRDATLKKLILNFLCF